MLSLVQILSSFGGPVASFTGSSVVLHDSGVRLVHAVPSIGGVIDVPRKALLRAMRVVGKDAVVEVTGTGKHLHILSDDACIEVPGEAGVQVEAPELAQSCRIGGALYDALAQVAHTISPEENRYGLSGVHVESIDGGTRFVSTDGSRLTFTDAKDLSLTIPKVMLLPGALVRAILSLPRDEAYELAIVGEKTRTIYVTTQDWTLSANLISADFPEYRHVLPAAYHGSITFDRDRMVRAMRVAAACAGRRYHAVKITPRQDVLALSASVGDGPKAMVSVPALIDALTFTFGVNASFMLDVLGVIPKGAIVKWEVGATNVQPTRIVCGGTTHILMPVRVD